MLGPLGIVSLGSDRGSADGGVKGVSDSLGGLARPPQEIAMQISTGDICIDCVRTPLTLDPMRSPGSDTIDGYVDAAAGEMQGARYESGLDNSPMYDGEFFEKNLKSHGTYSIGQMAMCGGGVQAFFDPTAYRLFCPRIG